MDEIEPNQLVTQHNVYVGMRVEVNRNPENYRWDDDIDLYLHQSGENHGTVTDVRDFDDGKWADVKWDNDRENNYPIGYRGTYSLIIAP